MKSGNDIPLANLLENGFLSLDFIEEQYSLYKQNPLTVDPSWRQVFEQLDAAKAIETQPAETSVTSPTLSPVIMNGKSILYYPHLEIEANGHEEKVKQLCEAYRMYGHLAAKTNPLDITEKAISEPDQLRLENFGFSKQDLPKFFPSNGILDSETAPLLEIINALKRIYCNTIGFEYAEIHSEELEEWLRDQVEHQHNPRQFSIEQKLTILQYLNKSELFESFIHTKYVGQKRFSLEGAETLIPMLAAAIDTGAALGIDEYVIGMSHRGRLNVLANIFDKSYAEIFSEFEEGYIPTSVEGSGDVKYHKGFYSEVKTVHDHEVSLTLVPNPSHLESVDPVVEGQVRSRQVNRGDAIAQAKVVPILVHGDAALAGQGVVYETLQMSRLEGYSTGGTIHFVVNNQIGFTTIPRDARSTFYCTDIAKIFKAPVFHVNAEDPEGCVFVTELAVALRQKFHCDVFIELMCYRKYGHNETDEPAFTQPLEYQVIRKKKPIREIYRDLLIQESVTEQAIVEGLEIKFKESLNEAMKENGSLSGSRSAKKNDVPRNDEIFQQLPTGVPKEILQEIGSHLYRIPEGLVLHTKISALLKDRLEMFKGRAIDWGMGETLAYASLLWEGVDVRLSGQDSCRGTFSHRHALLMDQVKEQGYIPLQHLKEGQGRFDVYNSPLSEYAVLGFEFGYSTAAPEALVLWEAQFGDFANGAQIIIDQYIASSEQKWGQRCPLTLLLPHGYEGQGPEHSSGRIERFLALAGDNNIQVVNPTTPAQLFHLFRRQALRSLHKPLIVFTPKALLRHPACVSQLEDFTKGSFQEILEDPDPPNKVRKLLLCSGKIFYDIAAEREKLGIEDLSIVRIEQLYPLNIERLKEIVGRCPTLKECVWVQEEPSNMGAWSFMRPILRDLLPHDVEVSYVGRTRSASPAVGSHAIHKKEHAAILNGVFGAKDPYNIKA
ncbi:MAG: 2-oxoglutarate dehydrogenase E1 component [Parachlamydiaceae bacterium]